MAAANGFVTERPDARYGDSNGAITGEDYGAVEFTAPGSGTLTITEIGFYGWGSVSLDAQLAIYTDDVANDCPESQVANSLVTGIAVTTNTQIYYHTYGTQPTITGGTDYWLCYGNIDTGTLYVSRFDSGGNSAYLIGHGATWPTSETSWSTGTRDISMYAVYTTAGGGGGVIVIGQMFRRRRSL